MEMYPRLWATLLVALIVCLVALSAAMVAAVLALRRTLQRTEALLGTLEREIRPTIEDLRGLTQELSSVTHEARASVTKVSVALDRAGELAAGVSSVVSGLAGFTRVGQAIALVAGLRRGAGVFTRRLRGPAGAIRD